MRVRYGKPIKVKSVYSDYFSSGAVACRCSKEVENGIATLTKTSGDYATLYKDMTPTPGHTYFYYCKQRVLDAIGSSDRLNLAVNATQGYNQSVTAPIVNEWYEFYGQSTVTGELIRFEPRCYASDGIRFQLTTPITIDLTEIGLDHLTAEQFYNKYNKYFPLIATGAEITIDNKAGQIPSTKYSSEDYIELEYLEATGTQYIDTGIKNIKAPFKMNFKFYRDDEGFSDMSVFGQRSLGKFVNTYSTFYETVFGNTAENTLLKKQDVEMIIDSSVGVIQNGELILSGTSSNRISDYSAYMFAFRENGEDSPRWFFKGKIYYYDIYEENACTYHFIPAIRKSDNEVGMLDKVQNIFYTNQGTGAFVAGPAKQLPSEYQEVEYIESTGTQYINASLSLYNESNHKIVFDVTPTEFFNYNTLWGSTYDNDTFEGWIYWDGLLAMRYNWVRYGDDNLVNVGTRYLIEVEKSGTTLIKRVNNIEIGTGTVNEITTDADFLLFLSGSDYGKYKTYSCKLYKANEMVRNFVPCYRKSDNEIGMYDLVNRVFYTNQGTGTFLKGNNINSAISYKIAGGSSDIYYGYNQSLFYDDVAPTSIHPEHGTYITNGKEITFTKNENTNYYAITLYNTLYWNEILTRSNCKLGDKILVSVTFKNFSNSLIGTSTGFGITQFNNGGWLKNPSQRFTYTSGQNTYAVIETVTNDNCNNAHFKILHGIGPDVYGELFTIESASIINLTDWYGAGKEPSTVEEFKERFAKEYYGFCPISIRLTRYQIEALPNYWYNQLVENGDFSNGINKWYRTTTYTSLTNEDGIGVLTITSSGATTTQINLYTSSNFLQAVVGHKYFSSYTIRSNTNTAYEDQSFGGSRDYISPTINNVNQNWSTRERILTAMNTNSWQIYLAGNYDVGNKYYFKNIMIIDLTDWYGEGNEPTTIEEFKRTFPNKYYPYSQKRLLNKYMINKLQA